MRIRPSHPPKAGPPPARSTTTTTTRPSTRRRWATAALAVPMVLSVLPATGATAQSSTVSGLTVEQQEGAALLRWQPVEGASSYEIERAPAGNEGDAAIVGIWRDDRTLFAQQQPELASFADAGFVPGERYRWRVRAVTAVSSLPNQLTVDEPSSAAGAYGVTGAAFGPSLDDTGASGDLVVVNADDDNPTQGCSELIGFPEGAIAVADRGGCAFVQIVGNAQAAGASAVIVVNNTAAAPIDLGGSDGSITIPSGMVSLADGDAIKAGLPATGTFSLPPSEPWSDPVEADTLPFQGPEEFRLQWESSGATQWTNHDNEIDFGERLAEASPRMRLETIGETVQGRRIDMYVIGDPPPATTEAIARRPSLLLQCQVHGNEPAPREACMIVARELALSSDRWVNDLLRNMTVLIVPAINGDGRANNTRGNATGQDLNRDYSLIRQPETRAFVEVLQQYRPDVVVDGHEFGNNNTGDLPLLWPRHRNVSPAMSEEGQRMVREFFFTRGADEGWWTTPYPWPSVGAGLGQETILRNTLGLKNHVGMLLESRVQAGPTRPGAGGNQTAVNQRRRVYSHVWTYRTAMDYHRQDFEQIQATIRASKAFNLANEGPVYLNGAWDAPDVAPIDDPPTLIVDPAPCGYRLSMDDYTATRSDGPTVQQRLEAHGMRVENEGDTVLVRLAQEQRGLIPLILDDEAPETMVAGERVYDCDTPTCPGTLTLVNTDTGITDRPANDQVCVSQLLDDQQPFRTNGEFVRYINEQTRQLRIDRILTPTEASRLVTTAARN